MTQQSIYDLNFELFHGWKERGYTFAVCSESIEDIHKHLIDEKKIVEFFVNSKG